MAAITIRDVLDETRDAIASRAALSARSPQGYVRAELIDLARPSAEALLERMTATWRES